MQFKKEEKSVQLARVKSNNCDDYITFTSFKTPLLPFHPMYD